MKYAAFCIVAMLFFISCLGVANAQGCPPGELSGDGNGDCKVDGVDYGIWYIHYGKTVAGGSSEGNYNESTDGVVDGLDYGVWFINYGKTIFVTATNTPTVPVQTPTSSPGSGVLQFKSGFESGTYIGNNTIRGIDYDSPSGINNWDKLVDYLEWVVQTNAYFEGGSMQISDDPTGAENKVLHMHNKTVTGGHSRSQWALKQVKSWTDDGRPNLFKQQFYRQKMFIPKEIQNTGLSRWFMIWESHVWEMENTRHGIYIKKNSNSNDWHFRVVQQRPEGTTIWENKDGQGVKVPFGEWFTLDVYFKYHETNGEFYVAITRKGLPREVTAHLKGRTKFDTKMRNNTPFKHYHHEDYTLKIPGGTHMYYDDFEIWSGYPPGY